MSIQATFVAILIALVLGAIIGAKFGRIILLAGLVGAGLFVLLNLTMIIGVIEKARTIAKLLGV